MSIKVKCENGDSLLSQEMEELFTDLRKKLDKIIYSETGFSIIAGDFVSADYYIEKRDE